MVEGGAAALGGESPRKGNYAAAGFVLQIDCPDLAMGRHIQYREASLGDFRKAFAERLKRR